MPNWATTRYEVKGPHDQMMGFAKLLMDSYKDGKKNPHKSVGFDASWLGYILRYAGLINNDDIENNNISIGCRGYISSYDDMEDFIYNYKDGDTLSFSTEWAWDMNPSFWRAILNKFFPLLSIHFATEEGGCGIYECSDEDFIFYADYYIYFDIPEEISNELWKWEIDNNPTEAAVNEWIKSSWNHKYKVKDIWDVKRIVEDKLKEIDALDDSFVSVERYEHVEPIRVEVIED